MNTVPIPTTQRAYDLKARSLQTRPLPNYALVSALFTERRTADYWRDEAVKADHAPYAERARQMQAAAEGKLLALVEEAGRRGLLGEDGAPLPIFTAMGPLQ